MHCGMFLSVHMGSSREWMCAGPPAPVHPQVLLQAWLVRRPGREEVGGEFQPKAPGIGSKSVGSEEVLGAEDSVSQCEAQGRGDDTPAILHHPCVWPPLHSRCLTRPCTTVSLGGQGAIPEDPGPALPFLATPTPGL